MRDQHKLLAKAIAIASAAHSKQLDRGGKAYILHPLRIMMRLRTEDPELMQIAVMHDVLEDSDWTIEMLAAEGFSKRVISALVLLTHESEDSYDDYIRHVSSTKDTILVKLEDLRDNSDITRLKGVSEKDLKRAEKYHKAFLFLKDKLGEFK